MNNKSYFVIMGCMDIGKILVIFGIVIVITGIGFMLAPKIPFLGKLPGDISYSNGNFRFYFPLATSIILSIILTIVANLFFRK
jgi:hypothetical protein